MTGYWSLLIFCCSDAVVMFVIGLGPTYRFTSISKCICFMRYKNDDNYFIPNSLTAFILSLRPTIIDEMRRV